MKTDNNLKNLQREKIVIAKEISILEKNLKTLRSKVSDIDRQIHKLFQQNSELIVSDHAIVRILQRRFGQQEIIEKVIKQIQEEIAPKLISKTCKINLSDNLQAIIENNVLITIKEN